MCYFQYPPLLGRKVVKYFVKNITLVRFKFFYSDCTSNKIHNLLAHCCKFLADPGEANSLVINSFSEFSFPPTALRRHHAQTFRDKSWSYIIYRVTGIKNFVNPERASKSHHWFKSYGHFTEGLDFAYWWSCIGKGLRLQLRSRLVF